MARTRCAGSCCPTRPPERDLEWSESGIEGAWRFVQRLWRLFDGLSESREGEDTDARRKLSTARSPASPTDIEALQFNKAVAKLYELVNAIEKAPALARSRDGRDPHAGAARRADGAASRRGSLGGDAAKPG